MERNPFQKTPDNNLNPETLEEFITPQLSMGCDELKLIKKIARKVGIPFVLTKSLFLCISDKMHGEIRQADGINFDDEMAYGRYYPGNEIIMQDDMKGIKPQTKILKPILYKKINDFLKQYQKHVADFEE